MGERWPKSFFYLSIVGEEVSSENPSRMEPSPFVATATVKSSELIGNMIVPTCVVNGHVEC